MAHIECPDSGLPEYTLALAFWIVPSIVIVAFLKLKRLCGPVEWRTMVWTTVILIPVGFLLDLVFGNLFLCFPCPGTTLGIAPLGIPLEEYIFYISGFWFIVLLYAYGDEYYLKKYNVEPGDYEAAARKPRRRLELALSPWIAATVVGLGVLFWLIRRLLESGGYPGYAWFLLLFAYTPYVLFWRITQDVVNRRALAMTILVTTLISVIWEVTLALPRGYWNYQDQAMLGIRVGVWHRIPIEAITVWPASSLTVLVYEYIKVFRFGAKIEGTVFSQT